MRYLIPALLFTLLLTSCSLLSKPVKMPQWPIPFQLPQGSKLVGATEGHDLTAQGGPGEGIIWTAYFNCKLPREDVVSNIEQQLSAAGYVKATSIELSQSGGLLLMHSADKRYEASLSMNRASGDPLFNKTDSDYAFNLEDVSIYR